MFVYSRFEELRAARGITKTAVAKSLGRTSTLCQDWKLGKSSPNAQQLAIIADILDTTVEYLTGETDEKQKNPLGDTEGLSEREKKMLEVFHSLTKEQQDLILALGNK